MYDVFIKWNETMNQKRKKRELVFPLDLRNVIKNDRNKCQKKMTVNQNVREKYGI